MKITIAFRALLAISAMSASPLLAGSPESESGGKDLAATILADPGDLDTTFYLPGWFVGLDGTLGVRGFDLGVDVGFDEIAKNLDWIAAGGLEYRRGKLGFILEGLYLKASFGGETPGPILSSVAVSYDQVIAEGAMTYRILESERGWLELLSGARYIEVGGELTLSIDPVGLQNVSEDIAGRVVDRATAAARQEINRRLPGLIASLGSQIDDLRDAAVSQIEDRVEARIEEIKEAIRDRIEDGLGQPGPPKPPNVGYQSIGGGVAGSGVIKDVIRDYIEAKVDAEIEAARARASAVVAAARAAARSEAERRLQKAEAELAKTIEKEIRNRVANAPLSGGRGWVDPFIGFRGRYVFTDKWFVSGRGDIGGFGVGSDLMWNLYGAVGYEWSERSSFEFGYRYLAADYQSGGFSYAAAVKGPYLGVRIDF